MEKIKLKIEKYNNYFQSFHNESFKLLEGQGFIIVSSPHSVEHTREGIIKFAEPQTGVLACLLHDELNCPVIYKTKNCNDDANYDENSIYKDAIISYIESSNIKFLIDLHQLSPKREINIDFGTSNFNNLKDIKIFNIILYEFTNQNIGSIQIDEPFSASYPYTISSYVHNMCKIQSIQIEINSKLLYGELADKYFEKVYLALYNSIIKINKYLRWD